MSNGSPRNAWIECCLLLMLPRAGHATVFSVIILSSYAFRLLGTWSLLSLGSSFLITTSTFDSLNITQPFQIKQGRIYFLLLNLPSFFPVYIVVSGTLKVYKPKDRNQTDPFKPSLGLGACHHAGCWKVMVQSRYETGVEGLLFFSVRQQVSEWALGKKQRLKREIEEKIKRE